MNTERERRLHELLEGALTLHGAEREAFLAAARTDPSLLQEVRDLLDMEDDVLDDVLERPAVDVAALGRAAAAGYGPGQAGDTATGGDAGSGKDTGVPRPDRIGSYRLLRTLGKGGMGHVYLAEQSEPVHRRVALKLIRTHFASRDAARRFNAERQAMARLAHPNVAHMYEAGTTEEGRPYFVMEHIQGPPVTRYCDERRSSIHERLRLFADVCRGVQHAHQKQILHRDLKPSNILVEQVDGRPVPKVIDFGIAKALDQPLNDRTQSGAGVVGTPAYMSPEALRGGDVDTRSDVYSLGIVLYELLAGTCPFVAEGSAVASLLPRIFDEQPAGPSVRLDKLADEPRERAARRRGLDPFGLSKSLRGDLDRIVLKAIAKDRDARYGSAAELAADVERYLRCEPVAAHPSSFGYRFGKLVHRHRMAVALSGVTALALLAAYVLTSLALVRTRNAEHLASREAAAAHRVIDFLADLFEASDPAQALGQEVTARQLLERGAERIGDSDLPPLAQARILHTLGDVHVKLGLYEPATELAEEALRLREELLVGDHPDVLASLELLGNLYRRARRLDEADSLLLRALSLQETSPDPDPVAIAAALNSLGSLRLRQSRYEEAEQYYRRALALRRDALGPDDPDVAASHNNLGALLWTQSRDEEAEPHLRRAGEVLEAALGPKHPRVADAWTNLGLLLHRTGRSEEALEIQRRVLDVREQILGRDHPAVAAALNNLAAVHSKLGRYDQAEAFFERALGIQRRTLGLDHVETAKTLGNLGFLAWRMKRFDDAERRTRQTLEIRERTLGAEHPAVAGSRMKLAMVYRDTGRLEAAERLFRQALEVQERARGPEHRDVALTVLHLGILEGKQDALAAAEQDLRRALTILRKASRPDAVNVALALYELAEVGRRAGRPSEAVEHHRRALELRESALPPDHEDIRRSRDAVAELQVSR